MEGKNKLSQKHLDAIPILLKPLVRAKEGLGPITQQQAYYILRKWDEARNSAENEKSNPTCNHKWGEYEKIDIGNEWVKSIKLVLRCELCGDVKIVKV